MNKRIKLANAFGTGLMLACFVLAFVSSTVAALSVFPFTNVTEGDLSVAGMGLGATGVWIALGFFVYAEKSRQEFEGCLDERLNDMFKRLEKCECKCGQESSDEVEGA